LNVGIKRFHLVIVVPVLAVALATGCGGGGGSNNSSNSSTSSSSGSGGNSASSDQAKAVAAVAAKRAAEKVVKATPDKHITGPKRYLSVCLAKGDPDAGELPPNIVKCHIEAFYMPYKGKPGGYIWSEDWNVPIQNGKAGTPVINGDYRIRNFLNEDNKKNCTGRHQPRECLPQSVGGILPG
jgi:hypothetical protein